jgi:AcrR family transcriptional regulator
MSEKLSREAWIAAGLKQLASCGVEAVRVESLARALGVTKGSFYWHFADRAELLAAILESWRAATTTALIDAVERDGGDANERLRRLSRIVAGVDGRADNAMRAWAATDAAVAKVTAEMDATRLAYLERLYAEIGFDAPNARARAEFVYQALVGRFALSPAPLSAEKRAERLEILIPLLTRR